MDYETTVRLDVGKGRVQGVPDLDICLMWTDNSQNGTQQVTFESCIYCDPNIREFRTNKRQ